MKNKVIKILMLILYYLIFLNFCLFNSFSYILSAYSNISCFLFYLILPFVIIVLPFILKYVLKINELFLSYLLLIFYIIFALLVGYFLDIDIKKFTYENWNNSNYCSLRRYMIDSLEKKYLIIGMNKADIYGILGDPSNSVCSLDYETTEKICYETFEGVMTNEFYCLYFDSNDVVTNVEYVTVD